jgi:type I restriction enzyme S subunit
MTSSWTTTSLGKSCEIYQPKTISAKDMIDDGAFPVYGANGIIGRYHKTNHEEPQLLITCRGATCGSVNVTHGPCWITGNAMVVRPRDDSIAMRFLEYLFIGGLDISSVITGSAQPQITRSNLAPIEFCYPPLAEQKRIVAILDEAFDAIATAKANAEKNLQNARALFDSHLNAVFSQRGEGWVEKPLADCLALITYGFTNPMPTTDEGPYMVTAKNVVGGRIDYSSVRRTAREAFDQLLTDKSRPRVGDVLLTKDGTLGRVAVVDEPDICINQSVALLRPNGIMRAQFMRHLLSSSDYQQRMVNDAGGTTIKHIYITRVDKMPVAFPESTSEQDRIISSLDTISVETQRLKSLYQRKLAALDDLKKSLLHQAFSGEF